MVGISLRSVGRLKSDLRYPWGMTGDEPFSLPPELGVASTELMKEYRWVSLLPYCPHPNPLPSLTLAKECTDSWKSSPLQNLCLLQTVNMAEPV